MRGLTVLALEGLLRLLQNRDLPGMIELMLRDAVEHVIEIVPLAGDAVPKPRVGQSGDSFDENIVRAFRGRYGLAPCGFCRCGHWRDIYPACWLRFLPPSTSASCGIPSLAFQ